MSRRYEVTVKHDTGISKVRVGANTRDSAAKRAVQKLGGGRVLGTSFIPKKGRRS